MAQGARADTRFDFACQRSGRCCQVADGVAFVEPEELVALARVLELTPAAFARDFVRSVVDPRTGEPRLALRDRADGACSLLHGANECIAYRARPRACVDFPFWSDVLETASGWERATATCPGIVAWPAGAAREAALRDLAQLFRGTPEPVACVFADGGEPQVSGLEFEALCAAAEAGAADGSGGRVGASGAAWDAGRPGGAGNGETGFSGGAVGPAEAVAGCGCVLRVGARCGAPAAAPVACRQRAAAEGGGGEHDFEALAGARDELEARAPWPQRFGPFSALWARRYAPDARPLQPRAREMG